MKERLGMKSTGFGITLLIASVFLAFLAVLQFEQAQPTVFEDGSGVLSDGRTFCIHHAPCDD